MHRPPASLRSLITFFIAANFKFAFAALPLLIMTPVRCTGERMPALFWCGNGANGGRGDYLYQVLYNPRWRCFPPLSAFLLRLIVRKCAWWMRIVVKAPQKGNKYSTGRMGISFSLLQELQELHFPINFEKVAPPPPPLLPQL